MTDARVVRIGKALGMTGAASSGNDTVVVEADPVRLVRAFRRIKEHEVRRSVIALVETLAAQRRD